jgi:hypothetical protein
MNRPWRSSSTGPEGGVESDLSEFETCVLTALVEGYEARQGLKDRIRALSEWEIARRAGFTEISYAGYLDHPIRDQIMGALGTLQRLGLISVWERGAQYDTFVPTPTGSRLVISDLGTDPADVSSEPIASEGDGIGPTPANPVIERLDEIIRLLRSIESKIGRS